MCVVYLIFYSFFCSFIRLYVCLFIIDLLLLLCASLFHSISLSIPNCLVQYVFFIPAEISFITCTIYFVAFYCCFICLLFWMMEMIMMLMMVVLFASILKSEIVPDFSALRINNFIFLCPCGHFLLRFSLSNQILISSECCLTQNKHIYGFKSFLLVFSRARVSCVSLERFWWLKSLWSYVCVYISR